MTTYRIDLPWPNRILSSNSRAHWGKVAIAKKAARTGAFWASKEMGLPKIPGASLRFTYFPPDRRKRDAQNMPHTLKASIDGIADAMGCDDHEFQCTFPSKFDAIRRGGVIVVEVSEAFAAIGVEEK